MTNAAKNPGLENPSRKRTTGRASSQQQKKSGRLLLCSFAELEPGTIENNSVAVEKLAIKVLLGCFPPITADLSKYIAVIINLLIHLRGVGILNSQRQIHLRTNQKHPPEEDA